MQPAAIEAMSAAKVTAFRSPFSGYAIYGGYFVYLLFLSTIDLVILALDDFSESTIRAIVVSVMALNFVSFVTHSWNALVYHYFKWPVTAIHWICQLSALGLTSSLVGYSMAIDDDRHANRIAITTPRFIAQTVVAAVQVAIVFEFFARCSYKIINLQR